MSRADVNLRIDLLMALAFVASLASGLVFLIPMQWIANADSIPTGVLGMSYRSWSTLHTASSLLMAGAVVAHLVLHARWIASSLRRSAQRVRSMPERRLERRIARNRSFGHE